ncbi:MAG: Ig-like domain-containing protein [Fodinibius sp.]|nr:Ig-like domain-containing protein [Fodinibius sp.]
MIKAKLYGRVVEAGSGEVSDGERILLYREPYDLSETASYIASTDTAGVFEFSYLREGRYKAFWVNDRNRNKIWDPQQERAQPFGQEFFELAEASADTIGTVYTTSIDTTNPTLQGIGLFSSRRMRMRFSENIQLTDSTAIIVADTAGNDQWTAAPLYVQPGAPYILFGHSQQQLSSNTTYTLQLKGITDGAENPVSAVTQTFTGSAQQDTTQQRIIKRNNLSGYYPTDPVKANLRQAY